MHPVREWMDAFEGWMLLRKSDKMRVFIGKRNVLAIESIKKEELVSSPLYVFQKR